MNTVCIPKQRGATLLISLILLLVLTILALAAGRSATLQQRMAGNQQQQNSAFQAAENGIQAAIFRLQEESERPARGAENKKCLHGSSSVDVPNWEKGAACLDGGGDSFYVEVEAVGCAGNSTGSSGAGTANISSTTCYIITSSGRDGSARAKHQQGYMF